MGHARGLLYRLEEKDGPGRPLARAALGVAKSATSTLSSRRLSFVRWSPKRAAWVHRWPDGQVADHRRWATPLDWATGGHNYDMQDLLWSNYTPKSGDTVFDIGAGHGGETYFLASFVGEGGRVVSIEAAPAPFRRLEGLVELNQWRQVEPVQVAVSNRPGTLLITDDEDNWVGGNVYDGEGVAVRATTFDDLCAERGITSVDWVKMNIEGAEKDALLGMERMAPNVRHMTISCHDFLGTEWGRSKAQVLAWLHDHGFEAKSRGAENTWDDNYVYAWRRSAAEASGSGH